MGMGVWVLGSGKRNSGQKLQFPLISAITFCSTARWSLGWMPGQMLECRKSPGIWRGAMGTVRVASYCFGQIFSSKRVVDLDLKRKMWEGWGKGWDGGRGKRKRSEEIP